MCSPKKDFAELPLAVLKDMYHVVVDSAAPTHTPYVVDITAVVQEPTLFAALTTVIALKILILAHKLNT